MQLFCLPSAHLNVKLQETRLLRSAQWEGCAHGDSQWTLVLSQIGSRLLDRGP